MADKLKDPRVTMQVYTFPLPGYPVQKPFTIEIPVPMSEEAWAFTMRVMDAMRPGLVGEPTPAGKPAQGEVVEQRRGKDDTVLLTVAIPLDSDPVEFGTVVRVPTVAAENDEA